MAWFARLVAHRHRSRKEEEGHVRAGRSIHLFDLATGWLFVIIGSVHNFVAAPSLYPKLDASALWFVSAGMLLWLVGALNLLRLRYAAIAPGVRRVSMSANIVVTVYCATYAAVTHIYRTSQGLFLLAVCLCAVVLSASRSAQIDGAGQRSK